MYDALRRKMLSNNVAGLVQPWAFPEVLDYWDVRYGITSSAERVSAWAPTLKGSHSLAQASGGAQPILLPWDGANYAWLPAQAGNYITSDAASLGVVDLDVRFQIAMDDYTPSGTQTIASQYNATGNQKSWSIDVTVTGGLSMTVSTDGSTHANNAIGTTVLSGYTNFSKNWFRVKRTDSTGALQGYVSTDYDPTNINSGTWTSLGTGTSSAGALKNSTQAIQLGTYQSGAGQMWGGKNFRTQVISNGALIANPDFTAAAEGATSIVDSCGKTWTVVSTGAKPAQIVGRQWVMFDGAAHFLTTSYSPSGGEALVMAFLPRKWTANDTLFAATANDMNIFQHTSSAKIDLFAGTTPSLDVEFPLGTKAILGAVFNGASSSLQNGLGTPVVGDPGAVSGNTISFGASVAGANFAGYQLAAAALLDSAPSAARLNQLIRAMASANRISV